MLGEVFSETGAGEIGVGKLGLKRIAGRAVSDHHLGTRQVQPQKRLKIFLYGDPPDVQPDRPRQIAKRLWDIFLRPGPEKVCIDTA